MSNLYEKLRKRLKPVKPDRFLCILGSENAWMREQFKNRETHKERFSKLYLGEWPSGGGVMDPREKIVNYINMHIVAIKEEEAQDFKDFLEKNFVITDREET